MSGFRFRDLTATLSPAQVEAFFTLLTEEEARAADDDWKGWAHKGQSEPEGEDWLTWVIMAGRGFGKTRAGAEWVARQARANGALRIALVAASFDEARAVMVEGRSGLMEIAREDVAEFVPTLRLLRFASGAEARLYSGADPEKLRGPEHHIAWCDELAKWERGTKTWENLQLGLRLGTRPRALVTTTPRASEALKRVLAQPHILSGGPTTRNPHLPRAFVQQVTSLYAGTRLGRQELNGELLPDIPGALWTIDLIERCRTPSLPLPQAGQGQGEGRAQRATNLSAQNSNPLPPAGEGDPPAGERGEGTHRTIDVLNRHPAPTPLPIDPKTITRTVIGVDPPAADGTCGIIACAKDEAGTAYVLADHSVTARTPEQWARAVAAAAEAHAAQLIVAEANQGGRMVETVLRAAEIRTRLKLVHATQGKSARADPIATLFEAGRVRLAGVFPELEAELCGLVAGGAYEGPGASPDRADAMVWALTELMLERRAVPRAIWL